MPWFEQDEAQKVEIDTLEAIPAGERTPNWTANWPRASLPLHIGEREPEKALKLSAPHETYFGAITAGIIESLWPITCLDKESPALGLLWKPAPITIPRST